MDIVAQDLPTRRITDSSFSRVGEGIDASDAAVAFKSYQQGVRFAAHTLYAGATREFSGSTTGRAWVGGLTRPFSINQNLSAVLQADAYDLEMSDVVLSDGEEWTHDPIDPHIFARRVPGTSRSIHVKTVMPPQRIRKKFAELVAHEVARNPGASYSDGAWEF